MNSFYCGNVPTVQSSELKKKTGVDVIPKRKLYVENFLDRHAPHYMSKKDGRNKREAEDV